MGAPVKGLLQQLTAVGLVPHLQFLLCPRPALPRALGPHISAAQAGQHGGGERGGGIFSHLPSGDGSSTCVCSVYLDFRLDRHVLSLTVCTVFGLLSPDIYQGTQALCIITDS